MEFVGVVGIGALARVRFTLDRYRCWALDRLLWHDLSTIVTASLVFRLFPGTILALSLPLLRVSSPPGHDSGTIVTTSSGFLSSRARFYHYRYRFFGFVPLTGNHKPFMMTDTLSIVLLTGNIEYSDTY